MNGGLLKDCRKFECPEATPARRADEGRLSQIFCKPAIHYHPIAAHHVGDTSLAKSRTHSMIYRRDRFFGTGWRLSFMAMTHSA